MKTPRVISRNKAMNSEYMELAEWFGNRHGVTPFCDVCKLAKDTGYNIEELLGIALVMRSHSALKAVCDYATRLGITCLWDIPAKTLTGIFQDDAHIPAPPSQPEHVIGGTAYTGVNDNYYGS